MNITILTIGSRGDVQPFVALGVGLEEAGHEVTLATGKAFEAFVTEHGLRHFALEVDLLERLQSPEGKAAVSGKNLLTTMKEVASMYGRVLDQEWAASRGADVLVYHPKALGGYHIAEALDVPGFLAHPVPMFSPTSAFPNPVLPVANLGGVLNRFSYGAFLRLPTAPYHRTINRWRKETLKLPPTSLLASELDVRGRPIQRLICCSPHVVPPPSDWDDSTSVTGYWFLGSSEEWQPPAHLAEFLERGPAPIYVGFGSLGTWASEKVIGATLAALKQSGQRSVFATSGGRVPPNVPDDVCVIDSAPHDWLFPKVAAVVHHGGAGTTAEGLRAGKPTLICPTSMNDQAFWGRRVFELGVGPKPIPQSKLTAETLGRAIHRAVTDAGVRRRAEELGEMIRAERGVVRAVEIIDERMEGARETMNQKDGIEFATTPPLSTGMRLHYAEGGDPRGEAIVFLHGYSDSWFSFSRVLPLLSPSYHAFALTQRGHGDSDKPECCYTPQDYAADVDAFMEAVGIDEATLVGASTGALFAQRVTLSYPRRVSRLVLIAAQTPARENEALSGFSQEVRALEDPVPPEFVRGFQESTIYHPVPQEFLETAISESLKLPAHVWRDYLEQAVLSIDRDYVVELGEIIVPTLILWGEQDPLFPREEQERLAAAIPGATLKVYPESGHAAHWERPEWVVRDLETFMKETRPAQ